MKQKTIALIFFISFLWLLTENSGLKAQSIDYIRSSGKFHWGTGMGGNYSAARRNALENLTESISVTIKSEFEQIVVETNDNVDLYTKSVVSSYSSAVIHKYEERVLSESEGKVEIMVFITKENLQELFRQREQLIHDFIYQAERAEKDLRISDALRYYYWALVLTRSHPDNNILRFNFDPPQSEPLMMGIYARMNIIFSQIRINVNTIMEVDNLQQKTIHLSFLYKNQAIQDLDYTYWNGSGFSPNIGIRDGIGVAVLEGVAAKEFKFLRLKIEYQYLNKANLEPEVKLMLESIAIPYFERAEVRISLDETLPQIHAAQRVATPQFINLNVRDQEDYRSIVMKVIGAVKGNQHNRIKNYFTSEGFGMYEKLIANGNVSVLDNRIDTLRLLQVGDEVMVRLVPMLFAFHNNRERFVENVVFTFNKEKKISGISFSLGTRAVDDILNKPAGFGSLEEKYYLIKFMEDFKTAFSLKRLDYLEAIFDENALIIVGNVVKRTNNHVENIAGMYGSFSNEQIEYIRLSKTEYMDRLRRIFRRNEFINIHFEESQIRKTQKDEKIYGIQIAQHYHSSTYADKGYLFLMIDLNNIDTPKIYVRTWQPEKNPDGSIFGLQDFRF